MTSVVPSETRSEANYFQKYLIPSDSSLVRYCMMKAGVFASHSNFFYAHFISVGLATLAVAMSFFNMISYFLQFPFKILLNIVQFQPIKSAEGLIKNLTNAGLSLIFVSMGMTFIATGLFFPKQIFTYFAPEYYESQKVRLKQENARNKRAKEHLLEENKRKNQTIESLSAHIRKLEAENEGFNQPRWCC